MSLGKFDIIKQISFLIFLFSKVSLGSQSELRHEDPKKYNSPWKSPQTSIIIDAYQENAIDWKKMSADKKVVAVIHRSSMGLKADRAYGERKKIAKRNRYLWGAYHLGTSQDPIEQAKLFLQIVGDDPEIMMALDLEDVNDSSMMRITDAIIFMEYVYQQTGRIPIVYANHKVTKLLNAELNGNAMLKATRLWYARFRRDIPDFPYGLWSTYFLWQFSSEINCSKTGNCLYKVPGTDYDMDVNVFYGTQAELALQWH